MKIHSLLESFIRHLKNSSFLADFGYTEGYKKISKTKKAGEKSHFFSKYIKNFKGNLIQIILLV